MMSVREAFGKETTTSINLHIPIPGQWNIDNQWVGGGYSPAIKIAATIVPAGHTVQTNYGEQLKPTKLGERYPEVVQIHSRYEMPINSIIERDNKGYKTISVGNNSKGGFWVSISATLVNFEIRDGHIIYSEEGESMKTEDNKIILAEQYDFSDLFIRKGSKSIPLDRLIKGSK